MKPNVSIGPASLLGWLTFLAGTLTFTITAITGSAADLHGPTGKGAGIAGIVALIATNFGRQLQAATGQAGKQTESQPLPSDEQEQAEPPPPAMAGQAAPYNQATADAQT
jgi:hypothetical protein